MTEAAAEHTSERARLLAAYNQRITPIMSSLALVYLLIFSAQAIFYDPKEDWFRWLSLASYVLWLLFVADLIARFVLSDPKTGFLRRNWLNVITVVVPQFRALLSIRAFTGPSIITKDGKSPITGRGITTAVIATVIVVWVGSLMVLNAERDAKGATITNFGDALWWAMETITTVGYGDVVPVTGVGRLIATGVMLLGISVLGAVTAGFSATLVRQSSHQPAPATQVLNELAELKAMVASLQQHIGVETKPATKTSD